LEWRNWSCWHRHFDRLTSLQAKATGLLIATAAAGIAPTGCRNNLTRRANRWDSNIFARMVDARAGKLVAGFSCAAKLGSRTLARSLRSANQLSRMRLGILRDPWPNPTIYDCKNGD